MRNPYASSRPTFAARIRRSILGKLMTGILTVALLAGQSVTGATVYWDADASAVGNNVDGTGLGGSGAWNTSTANWWNTSSMVPWPNTDADVAVFSGAYPSMGIPVLNTVTLASGLVANQISFQRSGYTLTGGNVTLDGTAPGLRASYGELAVIDSLLQGTDGLIKTGGGTVRLGNAGNTYTGITTINEGNLVVSNAGALGSDPSTIVVNGTTTRGFIGGALVLEGGYTSGGT